MTLMIERREDYPSIVFMLSGRIEARQVPQLRMILDGESMTIVLDLDEVKLVDREVVLFFSECEAHGITLSNCPAYIRQWIERERELR